MTDLRKEHIRLPMPPQEGTSSKPPKPQSRTSAPLFKAPQVPGKERNAILRERVKALINGSKGENYSTISAILGRNPSYIHQYITRGSPKCLSENDRRKLASHFDIDQQHLMLTNADVCAPVAPKTNDEIELIKLWPLSKEAPALPFRRDWLTKNFSTSTLVAVRVEGDAMEPTLKNGAITLIDCSSGACLRDGVYIFMMGEKAVARRLSLNPRDGVATLSSDNRRYNISQDYDLKSLSILGRVVWVGQTI